jgi:chromate transporter
VIQNSPADAHGHRPSAGIFRAFLKLGLSSFGGPIAHLGYFHSEFVVRRKWLDEAAFADLVALCQFLPGPASSQVGFSIGLATGGYRGALAAWLGFTLPSAVLMVLFAYGAGAAAGPYAQALLHGLKLVAVVVVAQAVWGMARTLSRGWTRAAISLASVLIALLIHSTWAQVTAIACGAVAGWLLSNPTAAPDSLASLRVDVSRQVAAGALAAFLALLVLPELPGHFASSAGIGLFNAFYRSGALVFGGGHVVLPLLQQAFVAPGWVTEDTFLSGYGAAQALPGPLFTFAAYLGAIADTTPRGVAGAALGLVSIFLPGILILLAVLPYWQSLRRDAGTRAMLSGASAAVVGLLAAALYRPLWVTSVTRGADVGLVLAGFAALMIWRTPPLVVVAALPAAELGLRMLT